MKGTIVYQHSSIWICSLLHNPSPPVSLEHAQILHVFHYTTPAPMSTILLYAASRSTARRTGIVLLLLPPITVNTQPFLDLRCLKPSVYGCVAQGESPSLSVSINNVPCRYLYGSPVIDFTTARAANSDSAYWNGAPHLVLVCTSLLLISLRIVPDDQCLTTTLDVFPVVVIYHCVYDLLIFSFFGL